MPADTASPLVSVVVPAYDAGHRLIEALDSVAAQDPVGPLEVVVVDDGSTDGSITAARDRHPDLVVLHQERLGPAAARNAGIARARGDFVALLDSDDRWPSHKLRIQVDHLRRNPACQVVLGQQTPFLDGLDELPGWVHEPPAWVPLAWRDRIRGQVPLSSLVARRVVFDRNGLFHELLRLAEDVDWFLRAMEAGERVDTISDVVLHRRLHPRNVSHDEVGMTRAMLTVLARRAHRHRARASTMAPAVDPAPPAPATVSVVIPLRGHHALLVEALDSLGAQTRRPEEVVVVDDGSEPDAADRVRAACARPDLAVRWLRQPPLGAAAARNLGSRLARGSHLVFLDADDRLEPRALEQLTAAVDADPAPGTAPLGRTTEFEDHGHQGRAATSTHARLLGAMLLPAAMVWAVGGFDETLDRGESMDLVHRAVQSGLTITSVDEPVLQRRLHGHNTGQGVSDHTDYLRVAHQAILRLREAPER
ncbi:MAG TPA: glycosyltransferase [Acidimicrobiales bacterium]|nr:glycosyltransferase [Acidimicrobiales bacterium]